MSDFDPQIITFCCEYCGYTAADLAGSMRLSYPASVKIVKVPCSGRMDTIHILQSFEGGADGVCIVGCLEGDCHFMTGNIRARKRTDHAKALLDEAGVGGNRLEMYNLSASDGRRFADAMQEMTDRIRALGPSPIKNVPGSRIKTVPGSRFKVQGKRNK